MERNVNEEEGEYNWRASRREQRGIIAVVYAHKAEVHLATL